MLRLKRCLNLIWLFFLFICFILLSAIIFKTNNTNLNFEFYIDERVRISNQIVCLVLTRPSELTTKAKIIYETWGKRCNKIHFATSVTNGYKSSLPLLPTSARAEAGSTQKMSEKLFEALDKIYELYSKEEQYEWFFIVDDDTYVIVENLNHFIDEIKIKYKNKFKYESYGYNFNTDFQSGGAGILIHRAILKKFAENYKIKCQSPINGPGDLMLARCLKEFNISLGMSRDENSLDRFLPLQLHDNWMVTGDSNLTINCCSERTITMHYVNPREMIKLDTLLYKIKIK